MSLKPHGAVITAHTTAPTARDARPLVYSATMLACLAAGYGDDAARELARRAYRAEVSDALVAACSGRAW